MIRIINELEPVYSGVKWVKRKMSYQDYKRKLYHTKLYSAIKEGVQDVMLLQHKYYDWSEVTREDNQLSIILKPFIKTITKEEGELDSDYDDDHSSNSEESGSENSNEVDYKICLKSDFEVIRAAKVKKGKRQRTAKKYQKWR